MDSASCPDPQQWHEDIEARELAVHPWLVLGAPTDSADGRIFDPLKISGLHRLFAALKPTEEAIREFALEHGLLGREIRRLVSVDGQEERWGEPFVRWHDEIHKMRILLMLFDGTHGKTPMSSEQLWEFIRADGEQVHFGLESCEYLWPDRGSPDVFGLEHPFPDPIKRMPFDQQQLLGSKLLVRDALNYELELGARPAVDMVPGSQVTLIPNDLLGAMYVMFAQETIGQSPSTAKCQGCGRWFVPTHGRQIYCDDRCKFKGYRQRKKDKANGN